METLSIILWVLAIFISNIALVLVFGRAIVKLVVDIKLSFADGKLTDVEIETLSQDVSAIGNIGVTLYRRIFLR